MFAAIIYTAFAFGLALITVFTLRPTILGRGLQPIVALVAMIVQWFVPQLIFGGVLLTALAALFGALTWPIGQVALIVHILCWLALAYYLQNLHRGIPLLDGVEVKNFDQPIAWLPSVVLRTRSMLDVEVTRDLIFREIGGIRLRADIYRPRERDESRPLPIVLYVHGGGWVMGTRRQSRFMMYELAAAGFAVFAVSYRLAPKFPLPIAIEDAKFALAWVREHAAEYGADPQNILVAGGSAGGHLAAMIALTPNDPRFQPGFESADTSVKAAVILYGAAEITRVFEEEPHRALGRLFERIVFQETFAANPDLFRRSQPISHVRADAPPILLVHGSLDALVPIGVSRRFAEALRKAGASEVHLLEVPHAHHAFELFPTPAEQRAVQVIIRFLVSTAFPSDRSLPGEQISAPQHHPGSEQRGDRRQ